MKNFKLLLVAFLAVISVSSCMKDDNNYDNGESEQARIDTILKKQAPILEAYAKSKFTNPKLDTITGIWYEELVKSTDETYEYTITSTGYFVTPRAKVKYKGELMDGKVFDEPSNPGEFNIASNVQSGVIQAWTRAFYPKTVVFNGKTYTTGLVDKGLRKGSKIRFISPSPWCYDNKVNGEIPADSPLIFTIEVLEIKDAQ